jgi:hypothetical protein
MITRNGVILIGQIEAERDALLAHHADGDLGGSRHDPDRADDPADNEAALALRRRSEP